MATEVKACPFCGTEDVFSTIRRDGANYECGNTECSLYQGMPVKEWNRRPIEDALRARIEELEAQMAALGIELRKPSAEDGGSREISTATARSTHRYTNQRRKMSEYQKTFDDAMNRIAELEAVIMEAMSNFEFDGVGDELEAATASLARMCGEGRAAMKRNAELESEHKARVARMHGIMGRQSETLEQLSSELKATRDNLERSRPLAQMGERAIRSKWWKFSPQGVTLCLVCMTLADRHLSDCPVPELELQLQSPGS